MYDQFTLPKETRPHHVFRTHGNELNPPGRLQICTRCSPMCIRNSRFR